MESDIELLVKKYALQNAVKYGKAPQQGAVMGKLMGEHPELRQRAKEISPLIGTFLKDIASGTPEEWQAELEAVAPELIEELTQRKEPDKGLKELPNAKGGVVMRFAPNPNGPPTLGSTRGIVVNSEYVKKYGGRKAGWSFQALHTSSSKFLSRRVCIQPRSARLFLDCVESQSAHQRGQRFPRLRC